MDAPKRRRTKATAVEPRRFKKGAAVAYDPLALAEFVTGFRKRKNARRLEAQAKAAEAEREKLRLARKEKREFIQETAKRMRSVIPGEEAEPGESVDTSETSYVLNNEDTVVTTTVSKMENNAHKDFGSIKSTMKVSGETSRRAPLSRDLTAVKKSRASGTPPGAKKLKGVRK